MTTESAGSPTLIQSLQRGMRLVEAVAEHSALTARELSDRTGIVLPTTYHLLRTLVHEGYLRRSADGRYSLGDQMTSVTQLETRARSLRMVRAAMTELAAQARGDVTLGMLRGADIVVTDFVAGPCPQRFECWPGLIIPGHATAIGKNILSRLPGQRREHYLATHPLDALTTHTVTTSWRLEQELTPVAVNHSDQQYHYGISCAATAVHDGIQYRALGIAFGSNRAARAVARVDELIGQAAAQISDAMLLSAAGDDAAVAI